MEKSTLKAWPHILCECGRHTEQTKTGDNTVRLDCPKHGWVSDAEIVWQST